MIRLLVLTILLFVVAWSGAATGLNPEQVGCSRCDVPPLVTCPAGHDWTVTIRDTSGAPIPDMRVWLVFNAYRDSLVGQFQEWGHTPIPDSLWHVGIGSFALCMGDTVASASVVYREETDSLGMATFNVRSGGCFPFTGYGLLVGGQVGIDAEPTWIVLDGSVLSFDSVDEDGNMATESDYNPEACEVALSDAIWFTPYIRQACTDTMPCYSVCADFDRDGEIGLADAILFTPHIRGAHSAARYPVNGPWEVASATAPPSQPMGLASFSFSPALLSPPDTVTVQPDHELREVRRWWPDKVIRRKK